MCFAQKYNAMSQGRAQPGTHDLETSALTISPAHLTNLMLKA